MVQAMAEESHIEPEEWRPVVGWEDRYEVSDLGRVRSLLRHVEYACGRPGWKATRRKFFGGCVLVQQLRPTGYMEVCLHNHHGALTKKVHNLVLAAFVGPMAPGLQTLHGDGV